jgi:hypothetical protein
MDSQEVDVELGTSYCNQTAITPKGEAESEGGRGLTCEESWSASQSGAGLVAFRSSQVNELSSNENSNAVDNLPSIDQNHTEETLHIPSSAFQVESSSDEESVVFQTFEHIHFATESSSPDHWEYTNMYMRSNSPMASNCNSDLDEHSLDLLTYEDDARHNSRNTRTDNRTFYKKPRKPPYKKFTYENIENSLSKYYDHNERTFTEMDVILTYLKGLRLLYAHSKTSSQMKLYSVLMLTIGMSMGLSIVAPFLNNLKWGFYLLSAGNAAITILMALSRYLKFEHKTIGFSFMANQCAKLETKLEFEGGWGADRLKPIGTKRNSPSKNHHNFDDAQEKSYFQTNIWPDESSEAVESDYQNNNFKVKTEILQDVEIKISEMREAFNELVPEDVIRLFPLIYNTNIFRFIKKMEQYKTNLIIRFRDIKNEIHYILYKLNSTGENVKTLTILPRQIREKNRILHLMELKEQTKQDLILCKNTYTQIDELFNKEIRYAETHQSCFGCAGWFRPNYDFSKLNPVVQDYLKLVVPD